MSMTESTGQLTHGSPFPSARPRSGKKTEETIPLILLFLEILYGKRCYPEGKLLDFTGSLKYKPFSGKKKNLILSFLLCLHMSTKNSKVYIKKKVCLCKKENLYLKAMVFCC